MEKRSMQAALRRLRPLLAGLILLAAGYGAAGQDRLRGYPGYDQYQRMSPQLRGSVRLASVSDVVWDADGEGLSFTTQGRRYRYAIAADDLRETSPTASGRGDGSGRAGLRRGVRRGGDAPTSPTLPGRGGRGRGGTVERGRQETSALSPDGRLRAFYRDRNLWLSDPDGGNERPVTTDGNERDRIKYGTASWVYGEELGQRTAMWWSPDSSKIAYYRFDESKVRDYYLQLNQLERYSTMDVEPYVKVGDPNPVVDLEIYELASGRKVRVDVRDGKPFDNSVVGHYIYNIRWTPDGRELLFNRTNRKQDIMELAAADPATGRTRVVVRETWPASYTENSPLMRFLADGRRFIWRSERTGFRNFYLYDLSGELLATLTRHPFEVADIVRVDEAGGWLYYMARDGDNHMKLQLHRVRLDGTDDQRMTDPAWHHTVELSPDGRYFLDTIQTHDTPPTVRLVRSADGRVLRELAHSDLSRFEELGFRRVELFTFTSADGTTTLHGMLHFPSTFDPARRWPLLVSVYGGPNTNAARETFTLPNALTEYGFLVASFDARNLAGRGKAIGDVYYGHLGIVEMDDQAAGVRELLERPYVDGGRVGVFGTSYGGTAAATLILRYPDLFHAAVANSAVTDYRNYDSIYAERHNGLLEDNLRGYEAASVMTYVNNLRGRLMIYYGTADNNVHPNNAMQLIAALQRAGKSFEVQVGPDRGHTAVSQERMMEFFIENLVLHPPAAAATAATAEAAR